MCGCSTCLHCVGYEPFHPNTEKNVFHILELWFTKLLQVDCLIHRFCQLVRIAFIFQFHDNTFMKPPNCNECNAMQNSGFITKVIKKEIGVLEPHYILQKEVRWMHCSCTCANVKSLGKNMWCLLTRYNIFAQKNLL